MRAVSERAEAGQGAAKPKARGVSCTKKYVHLIRNGQKRVEGRINDPKYRTIEAGSLMRLFYRSNARDDVVCVVRSVHAYKTFEEMLVAEGISNCLPGETSLENAVKIYRSFPGFSIKEKSLGVLAFRIEVHNEEHGVQCGSSEMTAGAAHKGAIQ